MAAPLITFTDSSSATLSSLSFGTVDADSISPEIDIMIWNNKGGLSTVSDTISATVTTKTYNGLDTGDTVPNGQEIVTNKSLEVKVTSLSEVSFTAIGGATVHSIGSSTGGSGIIEGDIGGKSSLITTRLNIPASATSGLQQFYTRVSYLYV